MPPSTAGKDARRHMALRRRLLAYGALYLLICLGVTLFQRRLIYFPPVFQPEQVDRLAQASRLERWRDASGRAIGMKRLFPGPPAAGRVLILYGNASCATASSHYADALQAVAALDVFILEYPGYADRAGTPSQRSIFCAAEEAFRQLPTNGPVYVVGESLGTGVAAFLAGTHPGRVAGVVLFAPYNRLADVAQARMPLLPARWMLADRFPSEDFLRNYHGPVGVLVAGGDRVVPERFGRRLYDHYAGPKRLWAFPEDDHGTVMEQPEEIWRQILGFLQVDPRSEADTVGRNLVSPFGLVIGSFTP
jgi:pimeloyl-ACP methyl ester carboxylesterase